MSTLGWARNGNGEYYVRIADAEAPASDTTIAKMIATKANVVAKNSYYVAQYNLGLSTDKYLWYYDPDYPNDITGLKASLKGQLLAYKKSS